MNYPNFWGLIHLNFRAKSHRLFLQLLVDKFNKNSPNNLRILFTSTYITTKMAEDEPATIPKNHQLKNELLAFLSSRESSSNWSAAKVCTHGL